MTIHTNWRDQLSPLDAEVNIDGLADQQPIPWVYGSDAFVGIDIADRLEANEIPVEVGAALRKLPAFGEDSYQDITGTKLVGQPEVNGTIISQRIKELERGYVYRLEILFGAAGNRRGASVLIKCSE